MSPDTADYLSAGYPSYHKANHKLDRRLGLGNCEIAKLFIWLDSSWGSTRRSVRSLDTTYFSQGLWIP